MTFNGGSKYKAESKEVINKSCLINNLLFSITDESGLEISSTSTPRIKVSAGITICTGRSLSAVTDKCSLVCSPIRIAAESILTSISDCCAWIFPPTKPAAIENTNIVLFNTFMILFNFVFRKEPLTTSHNHLPYEWRLNQHGIS